MTLTDVMEVWTDRSMVVFGTANIAEIDYALDTARKMYQGNYAGPFPMTLDSNAYHHIRDRLLDLRLFLMKGKDKPTPPLRKAAPGGD